LLGRSINLFSNYPRRLPMENCQNVKNTITNKINFFDTFEDQISAIDNQLRKV
jgi:hypothetical protein